MMPKASQHKVTDSRHVETDGLNIGSLTGILIDRCSRALHQCGINPGSCVYAGLHIGTCNLFFVVALLAKLLESDVFESSGHNDHFDIKSTSISPCMQGDVTSSQRRASQRALQTHNAE